MTDGDNAHELELARFALERARFRADILKWLIVAVGAVISFLVIDWGRLRLEQYRATTENERALLKAYLDASDAVQPDIWVRKLQVISTLSTDQNLKAWAVGELQYIRKCAAKDAVYRETLRTTAALLRPADMGNEDWQAARRRFEQLYWADLPYVEESTPVAKAMIAFRNALIAAEVSTAEQGADAPALNAAMLQLADTLSSEDPKTDPDCRRIPTARASG